MGSRVKEVRIWRAVPALIYNNFLVPKLMMGNEVKYALLKKGGA
jgi:hypothetical protein